MARTKNKPRGRWEPERIATAPIIQTRSQLNEQNYQRRLAKWQGDRDAARAANQPFTRPIPQKTHYRSRPGEK